MSISVDSCPANVDFSNFLACEKVISKPINIAYYLGDKLFDILDQINTKPFDDVLTELFQQHCNFASNGIPFIKQDMLNRQSVDGYVKTLKDLVTFNNFEYDISTAFDIIPINADLSNCTGQELDPTTKKELGFILAQNICRSLVLLYDKDIDLNKLQHRLYKLVSDTNNDLYIVVYDIFGEYHVPVEESETPDNIIKLNNVVDAKSVKEAYAYIRLNTSKYNS